MLSRLMTRREQFVVGFLGLSIVAGAAALFWARRTPPSTTINIETNPPVAKSATLATNPATGPAKTLDPPSPAPVAEVAAVPAIREIAVSVQGAIVLPGVYRLDDGSRIEDLVKAAGGFLQADVSDINLAARLIDGTTLIVPKRSDPTAGPRPASPLAGANPAAYTISGQGAATATIPAGGADKKSPGAGLINLNTATQAELESLPGVGPKLAQQIILYRKGHRFGTATELMAVPGIGQQRFEAIRGLITVK